MSRCWWCIGRLTLKTSSFRHRSACPTVWRSLIGSLGSSSWRRSVYRSQDTYKCKMCRSQMKTWWLRDNNTCPINLSIASWRKDWIHRRKRHQTSWTLRRHTLINASWSLWIKSINECNQTTQNYSQWSRMTSVKSTLGLSFFVRKQTNVPCVCSKLHVNRSKRFVRMAVHWPWQMTSKSSTHSACLSNSLSWWTGLISLTACHISKTCR
jgi:hypothetical protein